MSFGFLLCPAWGVKPAEGRVGWNTAGQVWSFAVLFGERTALLGCEPSSAGLLTIGIPVTWNRLR